METSVRELINVLTVEIRKRTVRNEEMKPFFGKISFSFQDGKFAYIERHETIK